MTLLDDAYRAFATEEAMTIAKVDGMLNTNEHLGLGRITDAERDFGETMGPNGTLAGEARDAEFYDTTQKNGSAVVNLSRSNYQPHEFED